MNKNNYLINITNNNIYISNYLNINKLLDSEIELQMPTNILIVKGKNIKVIKMIKGEILLTGSINIIEYKYND